MKGTRADAMRQVRQKPPGQAAQDAELDSQSLGLWAKPKSPQAGQELEQTKKKPVSGRPKPCGHAGADNGADSQSLGLWAGSKSPQAAQELEFRKERSEPQKPISGRPKASGKAGPEPALDSQSLGVWGKPDDTNRVRSQPQDAKKIRSEPMRGAAARPNPSVQVDQEFEIESHSLGMWANPEDTKRVGSQAQDSKKIRSEPMRGAAARPKSSGQVDHKLEVESQSLGMWAKPKSPHAAEEPLVRPKINSAATQEPEAQSESLTIDTRRCWSGQASQEPEAESQPLGGYARPISPPAPEPEVESRPLGVYARPKSSCEARQEPEEVNRMRHAGPASADSRPGRFRQMQNDHGMEMAGAMIGTPGATQTRAPVSKGSSKAPGPRRPDTQPLSEADAKLHLQGLGAGTDSEPKVKEELPSVRPHSAMEMANMRGHGTVRIDGIGGHRAVELGCRENCDTRVWALEKTGLGMGPFGDMEVQVEVRSQSVLELAPPQRMKGGLRSLQATLEKLERDKEEKERKRNYSVIVDNNNDTEERVRSSEWVQESKALPRLKGGLNSLQAVMFSLEEDKRRETTHVAQRGSICDTELPKLDTIRKSLANLQDQHAADLITLRREAIGEESEAQSKANDARVEVEAKKKKSPKTFQEILEEVFLAFASYSSHRGGKIMTQADWKRFMRSKLTKIMKLKVSEDMVMDIWYEQLQLQKDLHNTLQLSAAESAKGLSFKIFLGMLQKTCVPR